MSPYFLMKNKQLENQFNSIITRLSYRYDIRNVFEALLDAMLFSITIADEINMTKNPISMFEPKEQEDFKQALTLIGEIIEVNGGLHDVFGDMFMEYLSFGKNGQFFTPQPICDMIAQMQIMELQNGKSVCDPTCGSGRMLLAGAKINRNAIFFGSDIDLLCVKMTVLNLALNSLKGEIVWGDPLALKVNASFKIGLDFMTNFPIVIIQKESNMFGKISEVVKSQEQNKPQQLTLFD